MTRLLALNSGGIAGIVLGSIALILIVIFFLIVPLKPFFTALFSGVFLNPFKLASLRFRKIDVKPITDAYILCKKGNIKVKFNQLESHFLAGGSLNEVSSALIKAQRASLPLSVEEAMSIDLSTHDCVAVVDSVVTPKVVDLTSIKAITKDNFELEIKAKITVKANLEQIVGGLGLETLQSKVSKFIITKISSVSDHKNATPYNLTQDILKSGLDNGSGYQLLSVDIYSINISRDIGADLAKDDLERVKVQAQIESDRQRNNALILEQQMKVKTQEMKTAVLEAEAEVPRAIAEAIRDGRFSVMDYYKLMNLQADTAMRRAIVDPNDSSPKE